MLVKNEIGASVQGVVPVIFDVDGNLLDTERNQYIFYHDALVSIFKQQPDVLAKIEHHIPCNEQGQLWYIRNLMGKPKEHKAIISKYFAPVSDDDMRFISSYVDYRIMEETSSDSICPGVEEMLQELSENPAVEVYLVSGGSRVCIQVELERSGLIKYVKPENVYTAETYVGNKKEKVKDIMLAHNVTPDLMLMSGDGIRDMQATQDVCGGMKVYAIGNLGLSGQSKDANVVRAQREMLLANGADEVVTVNEFKDAVLKKVDVLVGKMRQKQLESQNAMFLFRMLECGKENGR